jgi:hypothetical protein
LLVVRLAAGLLGFAAGFGVAAGFLAAARFAGAGFGLASTAAGFSTAAGVSGAGVASVGATPTVLDSVRWHVSQVTIERTSVPSWWSSRRRFRGLPQNEQ